MKWAVLSMDVEDWYHLDYFRGHACNRDYSLLDGLSSYAELLEEHQIQSTFFVLGELVEALTAKLRDLHNSGHDLAVHGWDHARPLQQPIPEFEKDVSRAKQTIESAIGASVVGYRAPCFSMDRQRLDRLPQLGIQYDSSRIDFADHPLYGTIDMSGYQTSAKYIFQKSGLIEFEVATLNLFGKRFPVSGGGYIRILPWLIMKTLIRRFLRSGSLYVLYIHPFEMSAQATPPIPAGVSWPTSRRFSQGRGTVRRKLSALIDLLRAENYTFTTFKKLHEHFSKTL